MRGRRSPVLRPTAAAPAPALSRAAAAPPRRPRRRRRSPIPTPRRSSRRGALVHRRRDRAPRTSRSWSPPPLHLDLDADGNVRAARFDPPVAPDVNACAAPAIYRTRFTHGGSADVAASTSGCLRQLRDRVGLARADETELHAHPVAGAAPAHDARKRERRLLTRAAVMCTTTLDAERRRLRGLRRTSRRARCPSARPRSALSLAFADELHGDVDGRTLVATKLDHGAVSFRGGRMI